MSVNLLAICRTGDQFVVKRIVTADGVQEALDGIFDTQEHKFFEGVEHEIQFDGGWKPDKNELLVANTTTDIATIRNAAMANVTAMPEINSANFASEGIRALAVVRGEGASARVLLQNFSARQILNRKVAFIWSGDTFNRLTDPAFAINTSLAGILDADIIRFKSFSNIKMIFDLANLYQEATDGQIDTFSEYPSLEISDLDAFKGFADQEIRKLVHAVHGRGVLSTYDINTIAAAAAQQTFDLNVVDDRIVFPSDKAGVKRLLHFLDESFYRGPLSGDSYVTNSKRKI